MTTVSLLIADVRQCARLFRLGRDIEAALQMVDLIDAATPLFTHTQTLEQAWTQVLVAILDCQERQDWIGVADWLDVETVELLESNATG